MVSEGGYGGLFLSLCGIRAVVIFILAPPLHAHCPALGYRLRKYGALYRYAIVANQPLLCSGHFGWCRVEPLKFFQLPGYCATAFWDYALLPPYPLVKGGG